jgi:magnesium-protoporphyrin O-methyltransferase
MQTAGYEQRRSQIEHYFDRTAVEAWSRLTSNAPVGRIRQTVRAGRDQMRATLLNWLPPDLRGRRLLDAGCGTGALACAAAERGAEVVGVDLSPTLIDLARERLPDTVTAANGGSVEFLVGDMAALELGSFDHVVAMDSLIHYDVADGIRVLTRLADSVRGSLLFTFAPRTPLLGTLHSLGRAFPRNHRSPSLEPVAERRLWQLIDAEPGLAAWHRQRSERIRRGFYISQACELARR